MKGPRVPPFLVGLCLFVAGAMCAEAPVVPYSVCEILHDLPQWDGKPVAALGRYSFRQEGLSLGEDACGDPSAAPPVFRLTQDSNGGPKPPADFEIDGAVLNRKFAELRKHTSLGKFKFGNPDYDRWAVVYGRIEPRKGDAAKKAAADLVFRGDGVVVFLTP